MQVECLASPWINFLPEYRTLYEPYFGFVKTMNDLG